MEGDGLVQSSSFIRDHNFGEAIKLTFIHVGLCVFQPDLIVVLSTGILLIVNLHL